MTTAQLMHFVVRNVTYALTPTGVTITCYTNYPCHLYLRWTNVETQKHINPVIVRGAVAGTYIDQCFVVYYDIEQNEAGDTTTHTFTVQPWPSCETRYFYSWGTIGGVLSPSASCIFSYHRIAPPTPTTVKIYSDTTQGKTTVDGWATRFGTAETWPVRHDGPGQSKDTLSWYLALGMSAYPIPNLWRGLLRDIMTFSLLVIPAGATIQSARFALYGYTKTLTGAWTPTEALYQSYPLTNNNLVATDYQRLYTVPLSQAISIPTFAIGAFNYFNLNAAGLALLIPQQIVKLGLREATYDAPNIQPAWASNKSFNISGFSTDYNIPTQRPYLEITYLPP